MFSTLPKTNSSFSVTYILSSANAFNLEQSKILSCGKELSTVFQQQSFLQAQLPIDKNNSSTKGKITDESKFNPFPNNLYVSAVQVLR